MVVRRRRLAARAIDLVVVFVAYVSAYSIAALLYEAVSGCAETRVTTICGDDDAGSIVAAFVFLLGFAFPLLYESILRRTLGKTLLGLEVVGPDARPASRTLRLKRSFVTWVPLLVLAAGTLSTPGDVGTAFGTIWFLYVVALLGLVVLGWPLPWDRLLGTRVVERGAAVRGPVRPEGNEGVDARAKLEEETAQRKVDAAPVRRRYRKASRRR